MGPGYELSRLACPWLALSKAWLPAAVRENEPTLLPHSPLSRTLTTFMSQYRGGRISNLFIRQFSLIAVLHNRRK